MRIRSRFLNKLLAWMAVALLRLLFGSCRRVVTFEEPGTDPCGDTGDDRYLFAAWHDEILMLLFAGRARNMAGLVSRHHDGSILTDAMQAIDVAAVRGSSSRGGAAAVRELLETARHLHVAITPDGPRGPRHEAKSGIIFLASRSGRRIVPAAHACKRGWRIRGSWTDMLLPRPFTTIYRHCGPAMAVPADLSREQIAEFTRRLEAELQRVADVAEKKARGELPADYVDPGEADAERIAA